MKLYIARDYPLWDVEEEKYEYKGKLHIFYDTPELRRQPIADYLNPVFVWMHSRIIGEIPSYMYPEIKEGKCITFESNEL